MTSKNSLMILAATLVIALGLVGYFLYFQSRGISQNQTVDPQTMEFEKQSNSDETDSIEEDLNDTNLDDIDKESVIIEAELNSTTISD